MRTALVLAAVLLSLAVGAGTATAATSPSYPSVVFADGFESGGVGAWSGSPGTGSVSVSAAASHSGAFGARLTNTAGQLQLLVQNLAAPLPDSSVRFWVRVGAAAGVQTIAQTRDGSSSQQIWGLLYDGNRHGFWFYPYRGTSSTEIFTGADSAPVGSWISVEVQYTATATGGAQLYLNGQTRPDWGVSGDYTRANNLQRLQLWNDAANSTDFDDVTIAAPAATTPTATAPGAPTNATATAGDATATLTWNAPASDGGSPITSYRITPTANGTAQPAITTGTTATSRTITGLTNGTTYTFTVAATNTAGTSPDSTPSNPTTPTTTTTPPSAPGAPANVSATAGDGAATLSWNAPSSDGGSAITSYRITAKANGAAQPPITTGTNATTRTITGLTNGTSYTFTVAATNAAGTGPDSAPSNAVTPAAAAPPPSGNAIQVENARQGDPNWGDFTAPPTLAALSGYGSRISVDHGQSVDLYVTTTASSVKIDVFRMGWYGGAGARLVQAMGNFPGVNQPQARPDRVTGMVAEQWSRTATLNVPAGWTSGVYLARLVSSAGYGSLIFFVVRNDGGHEAIQLQTSVATYQAYNQYGGTSLYNNNTDKSVYTPPHATKVSFDRPFQEGAGAGQFLWWEYPFVRWLEKNGYDVTYTTDVDTHANANPLTNHRAFLAVGHDEYWSKAMRDNVESAIAHGVNVGFFAGNESYWQVRFEPSAAGVANRVEVGYKDLADCSCAGGPDPMLGVDNSQLTTVWRDARVNRPEERMMGVQFGGEVNNADFIVKNASNWVYAGTGWSEGTHVPGIVGYEYDHFFGDGDTPANTTVLSNTPVINTENNKPDTANATIYTAPSGATVFDAGTIQWSIGLDNFGGTTFVNAGVQKVTANILERFTRAPSS